jgi:hypothetical protein
LLQNGSRGDLHLAGNSAGLARNWLLYAQVSAFAVGKPVGEDLQAEGQRSYDHLFL